MKMVKNTSYRLLLLCSVILLLIITPNVNAGRTKPSQISVGSITVTQEFVDRLVKTKYFEDLGVCVSCAWEGAYTAFAIAESVEEKYMYEMETYEKGAYVAAGGVGGGVLGYKTGGCGIAEISQIILPYLF